jgi:hypothetical protein
MMSFVFRVRRGRDSSTHTLTIRQNRQAAFEQAKTDQDFNQSELELKTNAQLTGEIRTLTQWLDSICHRPSATVFGMARSSPGVSCGTSAQPRYGCGKAARSWIQPSA